MAIGLASDRNGNRFSFWSIWNRVSPLSAVIFYVQANMREMYPAELLSFLTFLQIKCPKLGLGFGGSSHTLWTFCRKFSLNELTNIGVYNPKILSMGTWLDFSKVLELIIPNEHSEESGSFHGLSCSPRNGHTPYWDNTTQCFWNSNP